MDSYAEGLRRTGYDNRAARRVRLQVEEDGALRYFQPNGAETKGIRSDGQDYPDGAWLTIERDGSGWFVAGLSTHAASGSMLPRA
ncbi:MAG: hypothetical protein ACH37Z_11505 [Anaerolineae bacterium]